jgi:HlyD family secretion protein
MEGENEEDKKEDLVEVVFVYDNGKAVMKKVKTGIQDNMHIEITEGIENEQEIITGPYRAISKKLKDGDMVKKVDKKDLFTED